MGDSAREKDRGKRDTRRGDSYTSLFGWRIKRTWMWIGIAVFIVMGFSLPRLFPSKERKAASKRGTAHEREPVSARVHKFELRRDTGEYFFNVEVKNHTDQPHTVYVVVHARNDSFSPPRRGAWPLPGFLYKWADTRRGNLAASDIRRDWDRRPEDSKGCKVKLNAYDSEDIEAAMTFNDTCALDAWRGEPMNPAALFREWWVWVFAKDGELIWERKQKTE